MRKAPWPPDLSAPLDRVLSEIAEATEAALEEASSTGWVGSRRFLPPARYSLLSGGKRVRPGLVVLSAYAGTAAPRVSPEGLLAAAVAVEMMHTYSLIHDDLPCMDDDATRRGKATCHVRFGVDEATWAGASLLVASFASLQRACGDEQTLARAAQILGVATGFEGMVGGQWLDTVREDGCALPSFEQVHRLKTASLMEACCRLGGVVAGCNEAVVEGLGGFGVHLGLAFQAMDDFLDATTDERTMGKRTGKDLSAGKITAVGALGVEGTRARVGALTQQAVASLGGLSGPAVPLLCDLARSLARRGY